MTKEPGTDRFAKRFHEAGFTVLAFDFRHLGESGGQPRQIVRVGEQLADRDAAIELAASLPEVDGARIAIWGFSLSGGHALRVASRRSDLAAATAHAPLADGQAAAPNAMRHMTPLAALRLTGRGLLDAVGGLFGREPLLMALAGSRGTVASLTTPDGADGPRALNPDNRYPDWRQEGRRPLRAAPRLLPAGPLSVPHPVSIARPRLRRRSQRPSRARHPRREASPSRRARPPARRATTRASSAGTNRPSRSSCPSGAAICSTARRQAQHRGRRRPRPRYSQQ